MQIVTPTAESDTEIGLLRARLRRLNISQAHVARSLTPPVSRNAVCLVLNEKTVSARIIAKARELADEKERAPQR